MCGCNKGRVGAHVVSHVASARVFPQRVIRGMVQHAPPPPSDPLPIQHVATVDPFTPPVQRFPPRPVNPRLRVLPQRVMRGNQPPPPPQPTYNPETTIWGPMMWKILHTLAEFCIDATLWNDLISRLTIDIPCVVCRGHFTAYIQAHPLGSIDTINLTNWFFTLHNDVNQRTNKPVITTISSFDAFRVELPTLIPALSVSFPPETIDILLRMAGV